NAKRTPTSDHPVVFVTSKDCLAFCEWLSKQEGRTYSLPTPQQAEFACRAGTTTLWFGGDDLRGLADYAWLANSGGKSQPIGTKLPNPFGLHDVLGNVVEKVAGPAGVQELCFGSAFHGDWLGLTYAYIEPRQPDWAHVEYGFRVALAVDSKPAAVAAVP